MLPEQLVELVVNALEDVKAENIKILDVKDKTDITDFMVIASGRSNRQVRAIAERVIEFAQQVHIKPLGTEGQEQGDWVLVDLGDVLVHAMQPATRDFYQLEKMWSDVGEARKLRELESSTQ